MFALGSGLAYLLLCPNLSLSDIPVPGASGAIGGPQYREIGSAEGFNYDSGDEEEPDDLGASDPSGRKRMTELASFSSRTEANNTDANSAAS
jgi:hypothetical protein